MSKVLSADPDFSMIVPPRGVDLRIIPFGGCAEFGMNLTCYIYAGKLHVVDCGVMFPEPSKLGVDALLPKVHEWFEQFGGPSVYILTHGHEDHIGGMPYVIDRWPAPIFTTPWTTALLTRKFVRKGLDPKKFPIFTVSAGSQQRMGELDCEFIHVNHSIPNSCALLIRAGATKVFHSGDFRVDETPIIEPVIDVKRMQTLGREGVDLALCDSTNAQRDGFGPSERSVFKPLCDVVEAAKGAVVITTFASNFWRLKTIVDVAIKTQRSIFIAGAGVQTAFDIASELGIFATPEKVFINEHQLKNMPREHVIVIATGSQGEWRSAMMRMVHDEYTDFRISEGDTVVFSSRIIPGNERVVQTMMSLIEKKGAFVVSTRNNPGIHVSGHAQRGEIMRVISALRPKNFMPIHGTFSHMRANGSIPEELGLDETRIVDVENGDVIDCKDGIFTKTAKLELEVEFIDGDSNSAIDYETLRERLRIGELGSAFLTGVFSPSKGDWLVEPEIRYQGIQLPHRIKQSEFDDAVIALIRDKIIGMWKSGETSREALNEEARVTLRRALSDALNKKPVVISQLCLV